MVATHCGLLKELDPEVVLMDIAMSGMNGLEATSRMRQECPRTKVLMLTMYTNEEYLKGSLASRRIGVSAQRCGSSRN